MKQLRTFKDLTLTEIDYLLQKAEDPFMNQRSEKTVANLFFEPSTRTKYSFEMAEAQMGVNRLDFSAEASSLSKGESLYDTLRTFEAIGTDLLVIRHPKSRFYEELEGLNIPIINAGDGAGDHPTQSLLDLLTMKQEFGCLRGLHVVIAGDILHSRVANTNAWILKQFGARVSYTGPVEWMPSHVRTSEILTMDEAVSQADVMMMLRIQTERHGGTEQWTKESYHEQYGLTESREKEMDSRAIIMHPAPVNRGVELADKLVECPRSRIFKQMQNGVKVRKAVLSYLLETKGARNYEAIV
ncbi:aspartate carbamoyltransferase catalytic subunit [Alkalicoccus halolimnae]|uniref:Aspartate carbamoyltransferase n=1 Tax=Alkalicoccus halolimnae TaxID=1667239 RepID=A0A5C7FD61_9BACI|nr:aspartate carbamoyltransferase catalytic subunit [Alkalicoccus halolimnae]TXF87418.1 aspartate carbamoyltransferase catalytic subunit [Alkalicoccus halolimnae]